jgi:hypothetical protein
MLQAAFLDCQFFDLCPFSDDGFVAPEGVIVKSGV